MLARIALALDEKTIELPPSLRALAARGVAKSFRTGHRLIEEGDSDDSIFIITRGRVRVFSAGAGEREVTYGTYGVGEYVGEMSLDGGARSASVEAIEPLEAVLITRQTLLQHLSDCPEFALELLAKVIRRARAATLSTRQLALNDVYGRLATLLVSLSHPNGDGSRVIGARLTHQEIAGNLGCSREMVGRIMRDLEKGRYIARTADSLVLLRPLPMRW
jgi:CRP/FNR family cyclic AMP-dependent transcriptional regulator